MELTMNVLSFQVLFACIIVLCYGNFVPDFFAKDDSARPFVDTSKNDFRYDERLKQNQAGPPAIIETIDVQKKDSKEEVEHFLVECKECPEEDYCNIVSQTCHKHSEIQCLSCPPH